MEGRSHPTFHSWSYAHSIDPCRTWWVLRCLLYLYRLIYGLRTKLKIMYRSYPFLEFKPYEVYLYWNVAVTCLLLTYSCQILIPVVSISFIFQEIYINDNNELIWSYSVYILQMEQTTKEFYFFVALSLSSKTQIGAPALLSMRTPQHFDWYKGLKWLS